MLYLVQLEPYEERYTEQWSRWIPSALSELQIEYTIISGKTLTNKIDTGEVLDVYGTNYYKFQQLSKIIELLQKGNITDKDTLWFYDLWFPGIESLFYIRDMTGINFKIKGVLHAGTWDRDDFTFKNGMRPWANLIEQGWLNQIDTVYLGSDYHRDLILADNKNISAKLKVTGLFFDYKEAGKFFYDNQVKKENIVVFPHRLTEEKFPEMFDLIKKENPDSSWKFIKTLDVCKTKDDYYKLLSKAKIAVSFSKQETFGYSMLEAMANGCDIIVPNDRSYSSMPIYAKNRYRDEEDLFQRLENKLFSLESSTEGINWENKLDEFLPTNVAKKIFL